MKRSLLAIVLGAVAFVAYWSGAGWSVAKAQQSQEYYVGADWGSPRVALTNRFVVFEDEAGTIRVVDIWNVDPSTKMARIERTLRRKSGR